MPAASKIIFNNECHSFVLGQSIEERDASERIPRPPNAFILYRSDFVKSQTIPRGVEKHQQNLSRIAGQCWNTLPDAEKAIWYSRAAVVRAEHRAKYPSYQTGPFRKATNRLLAKDKRRGRTTNSARSVGRSGARRTRTPYSEGMFAALHDSGSSSLASQASTFSPTPASVSSLSMSPSLSPLSLPHPLPSFIPYMHSGIGDFPLATSESPTIWKTKIGPLLSSSRSETPQQCLSQLIRDLEATPSEIGSPKEPFPALQYEGKIATCVPHRGLKQPLELRVDAVARSFLTSPESNTFSPENCHLEAGPSMVNDYSVMDDFARFQSSLFPSYLSNSEN